MKILTAVMAVLTVAIFVSIWLSLNKYEPLPGDVRLRICHQHTDYRSNISEGSTLYFIHEGDRYFISLYEVRGSTDCGYLADSFIPNVGETNQLDFETGDFVPQSTSVQGTIEGNLISIYPMRYHEGKWISSPSFQVFPRPESIHTASVIIAMTENDTLMVYPPEE